MLWKKYEVDPPELRDIDFSKLGRALKQPCAGCGHEHHGVVISEGYLRCKRCGWRTWGGKGCPPPRRRAPAWRPTIVRVMPPTSSPRPRELFPDGLDAFQRQLGLPLITHNRWIDDRSPYREKYAISGNVTTDRRLWSRWMRYLRASGVRAYEQDWLSGPAVPERDLTSGGRFMDAMAQAAGQAGITLQYCMPLPRHFLQGTRYFNLLTIRVSGDRFDKQHWASFLFNGRLASALGEWPWTDVFISSETSNLLLSTLSASIVGVGDALGQFDRTNLLRVVRADGVIVKPDDSVTPLDSAYIAQAN